MRKLSKLLGTISSIILPVTAIVSCGANTPDTRKSLANEIKKFKNFKSIKTAFEANKILFLVEKDVVQPEDLEKIEGYKKPKDLDKNVKISSITVKKKFNPTTHTIVLEITITETKSKDPKNVKNNKKDITITFAAPGPLDKQYDILKIKEEKERESTKLTDDLQNDLKTKGPTGSVSKTDLGIKDPELGKSTYTYTYKLNRKYDYSRGIIDVKVTIVDSKASGKLINNTIDIIIKAKPKQDLDTTKFLNESFEFTGKNGSGTVGLKKDIKLPSEVEVQYSLDGITFSLTPPTTLTNEDQITVKLVIKSTKTKTHKFKDGFVSTIILIVSNLK